MVFLYSKLKIQTINGIFKYKRRINQPHLEISKTFIFGTIVAVEELLGEHI